MKALVLIRMTLGKTCRHKSGPAADRERGQWHFLPTMRALALQMYKDEVNTLMGLNPRPFSAPGG